MKPDCHAVCLSQCTSLEADDEADVQNANIAHVQNAFIMFLKHKMFLFFLLKFNMGPHF